MKSKICTKCGCDLDKEKKSRSSWCNKCQKEYSKLYRENNLKSENQKEKEELINNNKKRCTKCNNIKELKEFNKQKIGYLGFTSRCKICIKQYDDNFQNKTKCRKLRDKKPESYKYRRKRRLENLEEWRKYERLYRKRKREEDPFYKIKMNLSSRISDIIRGKISRIRTMELLGCSKEEFIFHIENKFLPEMNWNNYGKKGWHVDHIKPVSLFDLSNENEMRECWNYKNLQPLWWFDNIKKGNKYE